jgi:hypothetical protein
MYQYPISAESGLEIPCDATKIEALDCHCDPPKIEIEFPPLPEMPTLDFKIDFDQLNLNLSNWKEPEPPKNMGVGKLGDPDSLFIRECRWTLESNTLDQHYAKKVDFDFCNGKVYVEVMELVFPGDDSMQVHDWIDSLKDNQQSVVFTTYDGCGNPIYRYTLSKLAVYEDRASFDYASSEVASRKLLLHYGTLKREFLLKRKHD